MSSFVAPVLDEDDEELEQTLRPRRLDQFVGQERVKVQLQIALTAAKARGQAVDHAPLAGPPGLGKTSLAYILREELGVLNRPIAGPAVEKKDIAAILTSLEPRDVLFVDEIHRMSRTAEEILYPALEDFRIDIVGGGGGRGAHADARPAAVHDGRRNDAHGPAHDAAARPFRADLPALRRQRGRARLDRPSLRAHPRRRDRGRRSRGDRLPLAWHAAHRQPDPPSGARRRAGAARRGVDHERDRTRGAPSARDRRARARPRGARAAALDRREVRRRPRRALDARRVARRGAGDDRRRLRAVSAPARLHPAHAARPHDQRSSGARTSARSPSPR